MRYPLIVCLVLCLCLMTTGDLRSQECHCADINCDGPWNLLDLYYLLDYLFGGGPPPLHEELAAVDWDGYETLTIRDAVLIVDYVFSEGWPSCPPSHPALAPSVDSAYTLYYTNIIPAGTESAAISLTLDAPILNVYGLSIPVKIRVDGSIPIIDSVTSDLYAFQGYVSSYAIYPDSGCLAVGIINLQNYTAYMNRIATIYLTIPETPSMKYVTMEWVNLAPMQSPTQDSIIIPLVMEGWQVLEPLLVGNCCTNPGDANEDGAVNVGDAVHLINCIFVDCPPPFCESHHDANCDGNSDAGDVVYLINYVFKGGPAPCCL